MADLIDRAALIKAHCGDCAVEIQEECKTDPMCGTLMWLNEAPTVDAVEVKYGHWQEYEDYCLDVYYACSVCDGLFYMTDGTPTENGYNFCPKCGARVDETIRVELEDYATD